MSLDKAIQHGKEHRKPYKGSKRIDRTCRNHGSCDWCRSNRFYQHRKQLEKMKGRLEMARLIDADKLELDAEWDDYYDGFMSYSQSQIRAAPTVEVVEVVRCENCKYLMAETHIEEIPYGIENEYKCYGCKRLFDLTNEWVDVMLDDFCSYGKRMNRERGGK